MRSDGPACFSPGQNRLNRSNPSAFHSFSPSSTDASGDRRRIRGRRRPPERMVERRMMASSPFPSPVRAFPLRVSAPPSSGLAAAPLRRGRLPGSSGEWRSASSRLPFFPFPLSFSVFLFFPECSGESSVRVLQKFPLQFYLFPI
jgi:hypothetical protein